MIGGLIQMTAHNVMRPEAIKLIASGAFLVTTGAVTALILACHSRWRKFGIAMVAAIIGLAMVAGGVEMPKVKELKCCASGPVSLEQIGAVYDIKEVDGALIVLWERR